MVPLPLPATSRTPSHVCRSHPSSLLLQLFYFLSPPWQSSPTWAAERRQNPARSRPTAHTITAFPWGEARQQPSQPHVPLLTPRRGPYFGSALGPAACPAPPAQDQPLRAAVLVPSGLSPFVTFTRDTRQALPAGDSCCQGQAGHSSRCIVLCSRGGDVPRAAVTARCTAPALQ